MQTPKPTFDTWLAGSAGLRIEGDHLTVSMPSAFAADWVEEQLQALVESAASAVGRRPMTVSYVIGNPQRGVASAQLAGGAAPDSVKRAATSAALRADFTFDTYVVGTSNRLAHAAAQSVAKGPGLAYNPLFLYGAVGLGKTHLMQAIGRETEGAGFRTLYVTTEQFTTEYLSALRSRRMDEFRERFRGLGVLLVDDIQFLAGKTSTQGAFFDTFNDLIIGGGQLVISSDRPAGELTLLEPRLRSRFEGGLQADIAPPDYDTRLAMLGAFAEQAGISIPAQGVEFIAQRVAESARTLQGCVTRLAALAEFTGASVTFDLIREAMGPQFSTRPSDITADDILRAVALARNVPLASIQGRGRDKATSSARQLAMHLLHTMLGITPEEVGAILGHRDRTTALYGLRRAAEAIASTTSLQAEVESVRSSLLARATAADLSA